MATIFKIIFTLSALMFAPLYASAATINLSPSSGTYKTGTTFPVTVYVESASQAMNAASGVVSFPADKLEVVSISKTGSIFSLWPAEPTFSNALGSVSFEGIVLNPGYTGPNGKILTITFRSRTSGNASLGFSSGSVLANDGTGTNILSEIRTASFILQDAVSTQQEPAGTSQPQSTTNTLKITSSTHPDQTKWYADNTPEFTWSLPDGVLEVRTIIGKSPSISPSVSYIPPISKKKVEDLSDGVHYFAVQARTAAGWGPVSRYRVNIDTNPPQSFSITFPHGNSTWEPQPIIWFNTTDEGSGVDYYDIKIGSDSKPIQIAPQADSNPYVLPPQLPGTYTVLVTAVDSAGNTRSGTAEFTIEAIDSPIITYYKESLDEGDLLKVRGTTYPDSDIHLFIREKGELVAEEYTRSNSIGDFALIVTEQLSSGTYLISARVTDGRGAQSMESEPLSVTIHSEFITTIVSVALKFLSAIILALLSIGALAWIGIKLWFKIPSEIARMRKEAKEAEQVTDRAFKILSDGVSRHITKLKRLKRKLTKEEMAFLEEFEEKLYEAQEVISKEIQDITK